MIVFKENAILELGEELQNSYDARCSQMSDCTCSLDACRSLMTDDKTCMPDANYGDCSCQGWLMDEKNSVVRLPEGIAGGQGTMDKEMKEIICFSKSLDDLFIQNEELHDNLENQKYGSWNGMMRLYPGRTQTKGCGSYDPRLRSWYVSAASGPKDIVIVIDKSGSMTTAVDSSSTRWDLAITAVKTLLKTLTIFDFVNVITFSETGDVLLGDDSRLYQASLDNLGQMKSAIGEITPGGYTNFEIGFKTAFDVLHNSKTEYTSNCAKAILFLTDGFVTQGKDGQSLLDYIDSRNVGLDATIFTYSLGPNSDKSFPKEIACYNDGIWQDINDEKNVLTQMAAYFDFYALGYAREEVARAVWVEPYPFGTDGTMGVTVSTPVYSHSYDPPIFLGVVGIGMSLRVLEEVEPDYNVILSNLITRSSYCPENNLTYCNIEALRGKYSSNSMCGDTYGPTCSGLIDLIPQSCPSKNYPEESHLWCNLDGGEHSTLSYSEQVCCPGCVPGNSNSLEIVYIAISVGVCFLLSLLIIALFAGIGYLIYKKQKEFEKTKKNDIIEVKKENNEKSEELKWNFSKKDVSKKGAKKKKKEIEMEDIEYDKNEKKDEVKEYPFTEVIYEPPVMMGYIPSDDENEQSIDEFDPKNISVPDMK